MNLDERIIALLKKHRGRVSRVKMWEAFNNYSRGYLHERLNALKHSGLITEGYGQYMLTRKGWSVKTDRL